jgi:hypothetical protein
MGTAATATARSVLRLGGIRPRPAVHHGTAWVRAHLCLVVSEAHAHVSAIAGETPCTWPPVR